MPRLTFLLSQGFDPENKIKYWSWIVLWEKITVSWETFKLNKAGGSGEIGVWLSKSVNSNKLFAILNNEDFDERTKSRIFSFQKLSLKIDRKGLYLEKILTFSNYPCWDASINVRDFFIVEFFSIRKMSFESSIAKSSWMFWSWNEEHWKKIAIFGWFGRWWFLWRERSQKKKLSFGTFMKEIKSAVTEEDWFEHRKNSNIIAFPGHVRLAIVQTQAAEWYFWKHNRPNIVLLVKSLTEANKVIFTSKTELAYLGLSLFAALSGISG